MSQYQLSYRAPRDALSMYCLSFHIAGWLPEGEWKMFQVDDATVLEQDETMFVSRLIGHDESIDLIEHRTLLFEFGDTNLLKSNLNISYLVYAFLLFEGHGYLVSSGAKNREMVCIQDGIVHFVSEKKDISGAETLVSLFDHNPKKLPLWIFDHNSHSLG